ncbi:glycosyltransferase family 2 protein [Ilumatobacter fluminis]|uniref:glycosyltransferase family 2 protein n=1 Tax=Ilumatobacter fluminis TaxID=467091 RepID=UPI001414DABE|nr:glycosyltransferase [Ilumatobacter fluminis]
MVNGDAEVNAPGAEVISTGQNLGIPAGRDWALRQTNSDAVGFLDDDAVAGDGIGDLIRRAFAADPTIGAVALRIVDEHQATARRHVPRLGGRRAEIGGPVTLFLGGACAIRRDAYLDAGGYWGELFYGHEEVELAWRLIDRGWRIMYLPDACVFHPRTDIGRHPDGWRLTGRNRVMIARRTLPWTVAVAHTTAWLLIGLARAPGRSQRSAYVSGWRQGWRRPVDRSPIAWSTVWRLSRLGRPPVV